MRYNFIIEGQSNADGRGRGSPPVYPHNSRIFAFMGGQWVVAAEPLGNDSNRANGPGLAFANRLCELHQSAEIGLIPCAKGATYAYQHRPLAVGGTIYEKMCRKVDLACTAAGKLAGGIYWQGESEGLTGSPRAGHWVESFGDYVARTRVDFGNLNLPWAFVRLHNMFPSIPNWRYIRDQQNKLFIRRVVMVSSDGAEYDPDWKHATTAGYVTMGIRLADAIDPLVDWT